MNVILAWRVEYENGEVELWPFDEFPDGPAFGETVTALVAASKQEPMAWLFKAQKPGVTSWWASVDENEIRQPERGEWTLVNKTPLYRSTAEPPRAPEAQGELPEPSAVSPQGPLTADAKDAQRYRWIQAHVTWASHPSGGYRWKFSHALHSDTHPAIDDTTFEAAIDAALEQKL